MKKTDFIRIIILASFLVILTSCKSDETVLVSNIGKQKNTYAKISQNQKNYEEYTIDKLEFDFENANFVFNKLDYLGENSNGFYTQTFTLEGNDIEISYVDYTNDENSVKTTNDYKSLPNQTLYINTDLEYLILSPITVYEKNRIYDSVQTAKELEIAVDITHADGVYYITYALPKNNLYLSEFFYLKSDVPLIIFNSDTKDLIARNELSGRFRLLTDGFYQKSYDTYFPNGEGNYFRNCANYPAYHYLTYNDSVTYEFEVPFFNYLSYASMYVTNENISEYGFFETKSRSDWLYKDFLIDKNFYDTRFNADNGEINILLFNRFSDNFFIDTLNQYGDFFVNYANEHSYKTENGILVEDYYNPNGGLRTHVSLNHHLANLNFLLSLYEITNNEDFLNTAILMLKGVEDTYTEWIMPDNNLEYALYYNGENNKMEDYPYLTYNDLFDTKKLLEQNGIVSPEIDKLMESKKIYMVNNGITGYKQ